MAILGAHMSVAGGYFKAVHAAEADPNAVYPEQARRCWWVDERDDAIVLYVHFGEHDPRQECVEITVRSAVFFPKQTGVNFIAVSGFEIRHAAHLGGVCPQTKNSVGDYPLLFADSHNPKAPLRAQR